MNREAAIARGGVDKRIDGGAEESPGNAPDARLERASTHDESAKSLP